MLIKTKFNIGDDVFIMYNKEPIEGVIKKIHTETMNFDHQFVICHDIYYDIMLKYKFEPPANIVNNVGPNIMLEDKNAINEDYVFETKKELLDFYYGD